MQQKHSLRQVFNAFDLFPLSVSSIGPVFSIAATGGLMAALAGIWTLVAILALAIPFIISGLVFKTLNKHFPNAGASYHWSARIMGKSMSRFQAWILIIAYFTSIPPIAIPAATYTLALVAPKMASNNFVVVFTCLGWLVFAMVPLLLGAKPTSNITKVFFGLEIVFLIFFTVLGLVKFHLLHVPIHTHGFPIKGFVITMVVAATILDGWEIDSFAAEESMRPRKDPGFSGLVGLGLGLLFYALIYPMLFLEVPINHLANSTDPLNIWSERLLGSHSFIMLIPIIGSTAGGLWLTTYILTRALYAMGRDNVIPQSFSRVNSRQVPVFGTVLVIGLTALVVIVETFITSLSGFFNLILSSAGFFLLAEFFLDNLSCCVFLFYAHKKLPDVQLHPHDHRYLKFFSILSCIIILSIMIAFFMFAPRSIGNGIDQTVTTLLIGGIIFAFITKGRHEIKLAELRDHESSLTATKVLNG
jgi:amino acid transporter